MRNIIKLTLVVLAFVGLTQLSPLREDSSSLAGTKKVTCNDFMEFVVAKQGVGYATENQALLKMLYDEFLAGIEPQATPVLFVVGGSSGAGKTTYRKYLDVTGQHVHDPDLVMSKLLEYKRDEKVLGKKTAFDKWAPFTRCIAQLLVRFAIQSKFHVIYDRASGREGSYGDLQLAKQQGYKINLIGLYVKLDVARQRILIRESQGGHGIPDKILIENRARFSAIWPYYLKFVDEATLYDTTSGDLKLICSFKQGQELNVVDAALYQKFLQCGDAFAGYFAKTLNAKVAG